MGKINFTIFSDFADRAWMLSEIGDWVEARKYFRKAIDSINEEIPPTPKLKSLKYSMRGSFKYELDDFEGALDDHNKAITICPNYASYYLSRADAKYKLDDFEGAIDDVNKFLQMDQDREDLDLTYYLKAKCNYSMGNIKRAIKDISKSINVYPNDYIFWGFRGFCHMDIKEYRKALDDFSEAIKINPEDVTSRKLMKECITEFTRQLPI